MQYIRRIGRSLSLALLIVAGFAVLSAGTVAAIPGPTNPGPPPPPTHTPPIAPTPPGYQVDVSSLPHATADTNKINTILDLVFGIIGAISLLMVTIGGFRYITSEGDPQQASKAKGTIVFALVGLLVSISAVAIVTFVLSKV